MLRRIVTAALGLALALLAAAQLVRDRDLLSMLLLCVPVWPVSLVAIGWDACLRGRALRRRGLLTGLALAAAVCTSLWTTARAPEGTPEQQTLSVVQWNTQWGGKLRDDSVLNTLAAQQADVLCLSEAPPRADFDSRWSARHPGWHTVSVEDLHGSRTGIDLP